MLFGLYLRNKFRVRLCVCLAIVVLRRVEHVFEVLPLRVAACVAVNSTGRLL
jgi:hypothetical protein